MLARVKGLELARVQVQEPDLVREMVLAQVQELAKELVQALVAVRALAPGQVLVLA